MEMGKQFEVAVSLNHDIISSFWLSKWARTPKSDPSSVENCVRLIRYAHGEYINVLNHFVYVQYGCGKQFEVAVSLNHDIITHFDSTSDLEPQNLSQVGWVKLCKAATVCPWTAYQCAQTLCIHLSGWGKQFEVAASLNQDVLTTFWLHMWLRAPKFEPSSVGITV